MTTKVCGKCDEEKDVADFYLNQHGNPLRICAKCENKRTDRNPTPNRLANRRCRQRATAILVARHGDEFRELMAEQMPKVREEMESVGGHNTRLLPGKRMPGEEATDRIKGDRCEACLDAHNAGHACGSCGSSPEHAVRVIEVSKIASGEARVSAHEVTVIKP